MKYITKTTWRFCICVHVKQYLSAASLNFNSKKITHLHTRYVSVCEWVNGYYTLVVINFHKNLE